VTAEDAQHRLIADFVRRLDTVEQGELPPLKLLQVRTADVNAVSSMLTQQYNSRPPAERTAKPVQVRADAATGTLIVSAHEDLFPEIKAFVDELNIERADGPARETFLFPLKVARAVDVASAMNKLYPEPADAAGPAGQRDAVAAEAEGGHGQRGRVEQQPDHRRARRSVGRAWRRWRRRWTGWRCPRSRRCGPTAWSGRTCGRWRRC
jgi:hypothetical protein